MHQKFIYVSLDTTYFLQPYLAIPVCFPINRIKVPTISSAQAVAEYTNFHLPDIHSNLLTTN